jgi:hypothetical protein
MRKWIRRRLARILAVGSTQYVLIAVGTASAAIWVVNSTSQVVAAKLDTITHALHKLH